MEVSSVFVDAPSLNELKCLFYNSRMKIPKWVATHLLDYISVS